MDTQQIRQKYIDFFTKRGHQVLTRSSLFLPEDSTTLFTGSGMQALMPYLLGEGHPAGSRLTNIQVCFRAQDIDSIGDNRHTTLFEMLGNWSLGDYSKEQQINWFFEFLVDEIGLDPKRIYVSVFGGDSKHNIPRDDETAKVWQTVFAKYNIEAEIANIGSAKTGDVRGIKPGERIFFYDDKQNWWSRNGGLNTTPIGEPCGPDSEVFYDFGDLAHDENYGKPHPASDSGRFVEIGNQVFMQYRRLPDGSFEPLVKQNIDFGGGLERISAASLDTPDIFRISTLWPIIDALEKISQKKYQENVASMRVITDHLRAAVFLVVDGVVPSNKEQGYVLRRLVRRAVRFGLELEIKQDLITRIVPVVAEIFAESYPEIKDNLETIRTVLDKEEKVFRQTLQKGLRKFNQLSTDGLTGEEIFKLYDTFGFPVEVSVEEAKRQKIKIAGDWQKQFKQLMAEQKARSQTASKGTFKGGLEGDSEIHKRYHTTAHLLHQALMLILGGEISQCGANITTERLRFDFKYPEKVPTDKLKAIEDLVNQKIDEQLIVSFKEYPLEEARAMGAHGEFSDKYGNQVKVYQVANKTGEVFSLEICGGPHVNNTSEILKPGQRFKIIKEESSSAGVRRIKAVIS